MKNIKDRVILITGGARGIGKLAALDFASRGAKVIVWDLNAKFLSDMENESIKLGTPVRCSICDVSVREDVYSLAEKLLSEVGVVDILINNAGIVSGSSFLNTSDEKLQKSMDVNLSSNFWTCKAFLPAMIRQNSGHIVTISSAAGLIGVANLSDYSASKFGVFGFHEALRCELSRSKSAIKTTIICPFFIDTGMFKGVKTRIPLLLPILKSEYVARRIVGAVLTNRKRVVLPRFVYTIFLLRLLPTVLLDAVASFFGINNCMDDFKGRKI
ncbi:hypothetical protein FACS189494_10620 [Spirochaetia bacterium]|nr:hypothetical protein FACS189494_10620 [Spirochaetia bacterium]